MARRQQRQEEADFTARIKELLLERRDRLVASINRELKDLREGERFHLADMDDLAGDTADESTAYMVMEIEQAELDQIERALAAIEAGTYGTCEECEGKIDIERLKALPFATLCIDCKRELERSSSEEGD
ncbi:MAG: molecular chaperone DnaK [Planctomycetota bacterium]|nr:MAG: molecular chaperone DnaK [Planctomycetota bacterium]